MTVAQIEEASRIIPGTPPSPKAPASINWKSQWRSSQGRLRRGEREGVERGHALMLPDPLTGTHVPPDVRVEHLLAAKQKRNCKDQDDQHAVHEATVAHRCLRGKQMVHLFRT